MFRLAFVLIQQAADLILKTGRKVTAADWSHSKHPKFGGIYATGSFSFGDGTLIPVWMAVSASPESSECWGFVGKEIVAAGYERLYQGTTMFTDRMKGANAFDAVPGLNHTRLACAGHIEENARKQAASNEKHFHINLFWAMQGARSPEELATATATFQANFPQVVGYLMKIDKGLWIHFAQVCRTPPHINSCGWRHVGGGTTL